MHYSRPAARRILTALQARGGSATTAELQAATRSCAVHSDVASAREYFRRDLGVDPPRMIECHSLGMSADPETGRRRRLYRYRLTPRGQAVLRGEPVQAGLFGDLRRA